MAKKKINLRIGKDAISYYTDDKKIIQWLSKQKDKSQAINEILSKFVNDELVTRKDFLKQEKKLEAQIRNIDSNTRWTDIRAKIALVHDLNYSPEQTKKIMAGDISVFQDEPLNDQQQEVKYKIDMALTYFKISKHNYVSGVKILYCTLCKKEYEAYDAGVGDFAIRHISAFHSEKALK